MYLQNVIYKTLAICSGLNLLKQFFATYFIDVIAICCMQNLM